MVMKPKARATGTRLEGGRHVGFRPNGSSYASHEPVDNQVTNFARHVLDRIRQEHLTPAEVVALVDEQDDELKMAFSVYVMEFWRKLPRYHLWARACHGNALENTLRAHGRGDQGLWATDPAAWAFQVRQAERARGERPSGEYVWHDGREIVLAPGQTARDIAIKILAELPATGPLDLKAYLAKRVPELRQLLGPEELEEDVPLRGAP